MQNQNRNLLFNIVNITISCLSLALGLLGFFEIYYSSIATIFMVQNWTNILMNSVVLFYFIAWLYGFYLVVKYKHSPQYMDLKTKLILLERRL